MLALARDVWINIQQEVKLEVRVCVRRDLQMMSCLDPDGPGQRTGDGCGKWRDGIPLLAIGLPLV